MGVGSQSARRIGTGSYGHRPMPVTAAETEQHGNSCLPFTPEDFSDAWKRSLALLPGLAETEVAAGLNGVFSFTPDGMPLQVSPFRPRHTELGAVSGEAGDWERPLWFEANDALAEGLELPTRDDWAAQGWSPIAAAEAAAGQQRVDHPAHRPVDVVAGQPLQERTRTRPGDLDPGQRGRVVHRHPLAGS